MTDTFSWAEYRSCTVKKRHRSYRRALLFCWWPILRGERLHVYACDYCAGYHVGHDAPRTGAA